MSLLYRKGEVIGYRRAIHMTSPMTKLAISLCLVSVLGWDMTSWKAGNPMWLQKAWTTTGAKKCPRNETIKTDSFHLSK